MNGNQGLVLYFIARSQDEQIARESLSPAALARREIRSARHGRKRRRAWWAR